MTRPPHLQATLTVTDADDSTAGDAVDPVSTNTTDSGDTDHKVDNESPDTNASTTKDLNLHSSAQNGTSPGVA